jgi:hypothetical protein
LNHIRGFATEKQQSTTTLEENMQCADIGFRGEEALGFIGIA